MISVAKRFILGIAVVGSFVAGSLSSAQAGVTVHGPFTWHGSNWPNAVSTGYTATNAYCWLGGFDVGAQYGINGTFKQDQAYVYINSSGTWVVSGAGKNKTTAPATNALAQAYCVDMASGGQTLFAPSNGTVVQNACPSMSDKNVGGSCWTTTNGAASSASNITWDDSPLFSASAWNNSFVGMMGISYDGHDGSHNQIRFSTLPVDGGNPNAIFEYAELRVSLVQVQAGDVNTHVAYGGIWPESNVHWFCAMGQSVNCYGVTQTVGAGTSGDSGTVGIVDTWGDPVTANSTTLTNYMCQFVHFHTGGADGEVSAKLTIDSNSQWRLQVKGPYFTAMQADVEAQVFCAPIPYYVTSP